MIFFAATSGGSLALVSYERASRIVSIVVIIVNATVFVKAESRPQDSLLAEIKTINEENKNEQMTDSLRIIYEKVRKGALLSEPESEMLDNIELRRSAQSFFSHVNSLLFGRTYPVHFERTDTIKIIGVPDGKSRIELLKSSRLLLVHPDGQLYNIYEVTDGGTIAIVAKDGARMGGETIVKHGELVLKILLPGELRELVDSGELKIGDYTNQIKIQRTL